MRSGPRFSARCRPVLCASPGGSVVAGVIILFKPSDSLATLAVVAGIFVLVQAIMELMASSSSASPKCWPRR